MLEADEKVLQIGHVVVITRPPPPQESSLDFTIPTRPHFLLFLLLLLVPATTIVSTLDFETHVLLPKPFLMTLDWLQPPFSPSLAEPLPIWT